MEWLGEGKKEGRKIVVMAKFFMQTGEEILERSSFLELYAGEYFLRTAEEAGAAVYHINGAGLRRSSRFIEEKIEKLISKELTQEDVARILAWKMGRIKHQCSQDRKEFVYVNNWSESGKVTIPHGIMDITSFADAVCRSFNELKTLACSGSPSDAQKALNKLKKIAPPGIGTTYLITLLFFLSGGQWPIIDRFAWKGLKAVECGTKPGEKICFKELPAKDDKGDKGFDYVVKTRLVPYKCGLTAVFGEQWKSNRDVDRALWVYGHLFNGREKC